MSETMELKDKMITLFKKSGNIKRDKSFGCDVFSVFLSGNYSLRLSKYQTDLNGREYEWGLSLRGCTTDYMEVKLSQQEGDSLIIGLLDEEKEKLELRRQERKAEGIRIIDFYLK